MESLYRKYRPLTFESVVGQQHIVSTLEHAVSEGRLGHAYLFCGPRGTGKTTMARILSKALLCEGAEAARATGASGCMACGTCAECEAIAAGTHPDVYELDAASRTGVDNVREEIINSVNFAPVRGAYKVYIVDEVHMLTTQAFNALLKTLEEPPSHVVFVLCTTDPQKLPETILSRCQRFDFHRISNEDIVGRMRFICEQEGFGYDDEALEIVARHARGGMRDALSTLEQLSVFGNGSVTAGDARSLLGEVASTVLAEFARAIAKRDVVELFGLIRTQVDDGNDLMELTRDLVAHLRDVYTARLVGGASEAIDGTPEEVEALVAEAGLFESADRVARTLTVLDDAALEMRNASDTRLVLEIACTRLARPEADLTLEALAERLARLEAQVASGVAAAPMGAMPGAAPAARAGGVAAGAPGVSARPAASAPAPRGGGAPQPQRAAAAQPAAAAGSGGALPWERGPHATPRAGVAAAPQQAPVQAAAQARPMTPAAGGSAAAPQRAASASARAAGPAPASGAARAGSSQAAGQAPGGSRAASAAPAAGMPVQQGRAAAVPASSAVGAGSGAPAPGAGSKDAGDLQRKWDAVVKRVSAQKANAGGLLFHARATSDDGTVLTVTLPSGSSFAYKMLAREDIRALLVPAVNETFGTRTLSIVMEGAAPAAGAAGASAAGAVAGAAAGATGHAAGSPGAVPAGMSAASGPGAASPAAGAAMASAAAGSAAGSPASGASAASGNSSVAARHMAASASPAVAAAPGSAASASVAAASSAHAAGFPMVGAAVESAAAVAAEGAGSGSADSAAGGRAAGGAPSVPSSPAVADGSASAGAPATATAGPASSAAASIVSDSAASVQAAASGASAGDGTPAGGAPDSASAASAPAVSGAASATAPANAAAGDVADQSSGPTVVPEPDIDAQRRAWEDEQVPYDDATIAAYEGDVDVPPISIPDAPAPADAAASPQVAPSVQPASASSASQASAAQPSSNPAPAAAPGALPWSSFTPVAEDVPQNQDEAKEMINNIFGSGVVFKPAE